MFCFIIYLSLCPSVGPSSTQPSLFFSFPIIHIRGSSLSGKVFQPVVFFFFFFPSSPLLSSAVDASKHAVSQSVRVVTEPLIYADWTGRLTDARTGQVPLCVFWGDCLVLRQGALRKRLRPRERWRTDLFRWIRRGVFELPLHISARACVCISLSLSPPPLSLQEKGLSPVTLCTGKDPNPSLCLSTPPPLRFLPPAYSNSWRGHMVQPSYLSPVSLASSCPLLVFAPAWHPNNTHGCRENTFKTKGVN